MIPTLIVTRASLALLACLLAAGSSRPAEDRGNVFALGDPAPAVLDALGPLDGLLALAVSADGTQAAVAFEAQKADRSLVRLVSTTDPGPPRILEWPGQVRDLIYTPDGDLLGLVHRPAKRGDGETYLVRLEKSKAKRMGRLPASASDLAHWSAERALLVACDNEIRTVLLDGLRSGPLFRITGENRAVESLGGSSVILVGRTDGIALVDLRDPPGREEMPARDFLETPAAVTALAASADGSEILARLEDGRTLGVDLRPLRFEERGESLALVAPARLGAAVRPDVPRHAELLASRAPTEQAVLEPAEEVVVVPAVQPSATEPEASLRAQEVRW